MDWQDYLKPDEEIVWQGRPAPRCYTFRNWKLAAIGLILFLVSSFWLMLGWQLVEGGHSRFLILIPLPLVIIAFIVGPGQILKARFEWERIFYCLTDDKLLVQYGLLKSKVREIPRTEIASWQQKRYGEHLASIRIQHRAGNLFTVLHCIEQPQHFLENLDHSTPL